MKIYALTDPDANIVATVRSTDSKGNEAVIKPVPSVGQKLHEIELPNELEQIKDADELHRKLKEILSTKSD